MEKIIDDSQVSEAWVWALNKFPDGEVNAFERRIGFLAGYYSRQGEVQTLQIELEWRDTMVKTLRNTYEGKGVGLLIEALEKIIEMNVDQAEHQYGDKSKAENWSCVQVARECLRLYRKKDIIEDKPEIDIIRLAQGSFDAGRLLKNSTFMRSDKFQYKDFDDFRNQPSPLQFLK